MTATTEITITITRWMLLRGFVSAWSDSVRAFGRSPWSPLAVYVFVLGVVSILFARGGAS